MKKDAADSPSAPFLGFYCFLFFLFFVLSWCCIFLYCWPYFHVFSSGYCFLTKTCLFFLTQNALERTVQPQFAYSGPQGTAKPFMCEYLTNQQITGWNAERVLQFSGEQFLASHLQIHRHLLTFKDISAPLIFDQALHNTVCICMRACSLSLV